MHLYEIAAARSRGRGIIFFPGRCSGWYAPSWIIKLGKYTIVNDARRGMYEDKGAGAAARREIGFPALRMRAFGVAALRSVREIVDKRG